VYQQQIDRRDAESVEALADRPGDLVAPEVRPPYLRREEDVRPVDVGGGDALADRRLVAVHLGRVDVPVAHLQGLPDRLGAGFAGGLPRSGAEFRDRRPARADGLHGLPSERAVKKRCRLRVSDRGYSPFQPVKT
jgi:hypothetical protein